VSIFFLWRRTFCTNKFHWIYYFESVKNTLSLILSLILSLSLSLEIFLSRCKIIGN
jgi:hypothetical protein